MKLLSLALVSVLIAVSNAITFSSLATVALTLLNLNKPAQCFFGMFRRRKSPPIEETMAPPSNPFSFPGQPPMPPFFNQFGGFGGGMQFPGFNPAFGMMGQNQFPPQFNNPPKMPPMRPPPEQQRPPAQPAFPQQPGFPPQQSGFSQPPPMSQFPSQGQGMPDMPSDMDSFQDGDDEAPGMNTEEAESFFTLLAETDESKCISRLVCEMGAKPESGGEFGQQIADIIGSLKDFPDGSKVSEYNEIFNIGAKQGLSACLSKFSICDEESYQLVKNAQDDGE